MTLPHFEKLLDTYADLITATGVNIRSGQDVLIYADIDQSQLVHKLVDAAYKRGAANVQVQWGDPYTKHAFLAHAPEASLEEIPTWMAVRSQNIADKATSRIAVISEDPDGFSDLDSKRVSTYEHALQRANKPVRMATMNNDLDWVVVGAASPAWARKVFPHLDTEAAVDQLWMEIFKTTRVSLHDDTQEAWTKHIELLNTKATWLTDHQFKALHFKSPITDLTVGLAEDHVWEAADSVDKAGFNFVANMPTEEVFTSPDARYIDGTVTSTKPLSYAGTLITNIKLTFEAGHVVEASADTGEEILKELISTDAGASSLGEVSLVPDPSPISQSGIIFYNTLFDENASDHLALGASYPSNIKGGTQMSEEDRLARGQNESTVHVDFMIGSADMDVDGITATGETVPVFRNGDWAK